MKRVIMILMATALLASPAAAQTGVSTPPREAAVLETVSVTGTATLSQMADRVTFTAGVQTTAPSVEDAVRQNNQKVQQVLDALKRAGVEAKDLKTSHFELYPQERYTEERGPVVTGYRVANQITVRRNMPVDIGKLMQTAITAGANTVTGLHFSVSEPARAHAEGLKNAFANARQKAEALAAAAGRRVGRAISITEGTALQQPQPMMRAVAMEARDSASVPIESGREETQFTVSVIFELL